MHVVADQTTGKCCVCQHMHACWVLQLALPSPWQLQLALPSQALGVVHSANACIVNPLVFLRAPSGICLQIAWACSVTTASSPP